jgi:peptidyl-prolyl cis-trans isomerase SurA
VPAGLAHKAPSALQIVDRAMLKTVAKPHTFQRWLASLAFAAMFGLPAIASAQVVVVANGSPITAYDIEQRSKLLASSSHKTPPRQDVINELINERIEIAKAKTYGLEIKDKDVDKAFTTMALRQHITVAQFSQLLGRTGIEPSTVKARLRAQMTWSELVRGKFGPSLEVGDSDVANALRASNETESAAESVGFIYTLYPIMIVIQRDSPAAFVEAKRREAEILRARFVACKEGLNYARAMRDVAVREPVTRSSADLTPALRDLLGSMPMGHLTTPDATPQGLQMFALCGKKETKTDSPIKHELREKIFNERFEAQSKRYLDEIRKEAMIEYKEAR